MSRLRSQLILFAAVLVSALASGCNHDIRAAETATAVPAPTAAQRGEPATGAPYYGFTPFPYDFTGEAVKRTVQIISAHSTLYALHLDDCVPWAAALDDKPFPAKVQNKWNDEAGRIPSHHKVYVGLAPLAKDRKSLAPACGSLPSALRGADLDSAAVKRAYLNYARRAVAMFHPDFLNLGIEAGELAARKPSEWPQFVSLYRYVRAELKRQYPHMDIGISFGLQSLRRPDVAKRARPLVDDSDYLGLSFYPHMSGFGEKFGDPALPAGRNAWREPLAWVHRYTNKPIAICETGLSTQNVRLPDFNLSLHGDRQTQAEYVHDLVRISKQDHFLFVVWFLAVDYDKLYAKLPKGPGSDVNLLWRNIGLFDGNVQPKPAWKEWQAFADGSPSAAPAQSPAAAPAARAPPAPAPSSGVAVGFSSSSDLFTCAPGTQVNLANTGPQSGQKSMHWQFNYQSGQWAWCVKPVPTGELNGAGTLEFWARSDRSGQVFVQLQEAGGETFFTTVDIGQTWKRYRLPLSSLQPDPKKRRDGRLEPDQVNQLLIADPAATNGSRGKRQVWLSGWRFD